MSSKCQNHRGSIVRLRVPKNGTVKGCVGGWFLLAHSRHVFPRFHVHIDHHVPNVSCKIFMFPMNKAVFERSVYVYLTTLKILKHLGRGCLEYFKTNPYYHHQISSRTKHGIHQQKIHPMSTCFQNVTSSNEDLKRCHHFSFNEKRLNHIPPWRLVNSDAHHRHKSSKYTYSSNL